jgi:predicted HicB family RNase H-like nuclease
MALETWTALNFKISIQQTMFLAKCKALTELNGFTPAKNCKKHFMARIRSFLHLGLNIE